MEAERQGEEWKKQEGREAGRGERRGALRIQQNQRKPTELNRQTPGRAGPEPSFPREVVRMVECMLDQTGHTDPQGAEGAEQLGAPSSYTQTIDLRPPGGQWLQDPPWMESKQQRDHFTALSGKPPNQESLLPGHLRAIECRCTPGYSQWARMCRDLCRPAGQPRQTDSEAWAAWTKPVAHGTRLYVGSGSEVAGVTSVIPPLHSVRVISPPRH